MITLKARPDGHDHEAMVTITNTKHEPDPSPGEHDARTTA